MAETVTDNQTQQRYELAVDGHIAFAEYRRTNDSVIITHTETPTALRGRGIASQLIGGALAHIRGEGLKVVPACGYVVDYLKKHPEHADIVK